MRRRCGWYDTIPDISEGSREAAIAAAACVGDEGDADVDADADADANADADADDTPCESCCRSF